jgi:hypothetical protein
MPLRLLLYALIGTMAAFLSLMIGDFAGLTGCIIGFLANELMDWVYDDVGRSNNTNNPKE